ncbi:MAG: Rpn family recombination-promoting nuclease/putative transposase [Lachnospiraceae bacterium]|nr:Rpn family recombination-promoting nuclease/putative transposase [Lachnospiraceae bacterium]
MNRNHWEYLPLSNSFIFNKVMSQPENVMPLLRALFPGADIKTIRTADYEKVMETAPDIHGVRFDVYIVMDNQETYVLEMQVELYDDIPLRSRYYASMTDEEILFRGESYSSLAPVCIIFICLKDLFNGGRRLYTFRNLCVENHAIHLPDRSSRLFLIAADGERQGLNDLVNRFLDYIQDGKVRDAYTLQLDKAVRKANDSPENRRYYMRYIAELNHARAVAREEGLREGIMEGERKGERKGVRKGVRKGRMLGIQESIRNTVAILRRMSMSDERICEELCTQFHLTPDQAQKYL